MLCEGLHFPIESSSYILYIISSKDCDQVYLHDQFRRVCCTGRCKFHSRIVSESEVLARAKPLSRMSAKEHEIESRYYRMMCQARDQRCTDPERFCCEVDALVQKARSNGLRLGQIQAGQLLTRMFALCLRHKVRAHS